MYYPHRRLAVLGQRFPPKTFDPELRFLGERTKQVSSYRGSADRPDQARAIAAVAAVHVALAAVILTGLNVEFARRAVEHLTTLDIREPPPPPRVPLPPPTSKPQRMKKSAGAPARKAEPTPVVAPEPRIPEPSPIPAAKVAGIGSASISGASTSGAGTGAGGSGNGTGGGRKQQFRGLFAAGARPELRSTRLSDACCGAPPNWVGCRVADGRADRHAQQLRHLPLERGRICRPRPVPADPGAAALPSRSRQSRAADSLPAPVHCDVEDLISAPR